MPDLNRRTLLPLPLAAGLLGLAPALLHARPPLPARAESPLVGTDPLLISTGLTAGWEAAMRQDLGWAARWQAMDTGTVLAQLEQGQIDAGLFLQHPKADQLEHQGLIYNRQTIARTDVLLVGPVEDVAGIRGETDAGRALRQVLAACAAGVAQWQPAESGSALALLADTLSQGLASKPLRPAVTTTPRAPTAAYRLITQAQWLRRPNQGEALKVWLSGPPHLRLAAQVACSYRSRHTGNKFLVSWLQGPVAQSTIRRAGKGWQTLADSKG